jgi:hypothetical protein
VVGCDRGSFLNGRGFWLETAMKAFRDLATLAEDSIALFLFPPKNILPTASENIIKKL